MPSIRATVLLSALLASGALAQEPKDFLARHCLDCHDADLQKGGLRLDTLSLPTKAPHTADTWSKVVSLIESGEMPPAKKPRPKAPVRAAFAAAIGDELAKALYPTPGLRRMNRTEYENTVHDLLGTDTPLSDLLPEDSSVQGFDNVATGLGISSILMERYLEAANAAFEGAIRRIRPAPAATRRAVLMERKENIESVDKKKGGVIEVGGAFVDFTPGWPPARIDSAHPIEDGVYRCRAAVFPHEPGGHRTLTVAVFTGPLFGDGKRVLQGIYDVGGTPENPRIIEFTTRMKEGHTLHILPWVFPEHVTWRDKHEERPGVGILWAETHGPLDQAFPAASQRTLFGNSATLRMVEGESYYIRHRRGVKRQHVESDSPREDVERIIRELAPRAFRRPVEKDLVDQFVGLALARLDEGGSFEQAVRAGVSALLCSPHFLLVNRHPEVDDYEIASRLSYFLWSSMPDGVLLKLAAAGRLSDPKIRRAQVERMLADPKRERFVENFTGQWLNLRDIEFTTPDKKLYPEFDELLLRSMLAETHGFFRHILTNDLSVVNFVDSDFAILNQRLADHYGIQGVKGHEKLRVVQLPTDSMRGGVMAQASVLKVTANGTSTSPVLRGVWALDKLLGQPASAPPSGVPAVEPDIRGATTIREQLDKHRDIASCARCHVRIDPPGFAMEQFNAIGGEREYYRSLGKNRQGRVKNTVYYVGPDVEKGGQWEDGTKFGGFREFRRQMAAKPDLVARSLAEKLLIYGTGRPVGLADRAAVEEIVAQAKAQGLGLRSMIHAVVESDLFLRP